jgi:phage terminase large subunit-like protein
MPDLEFMATATCMGGLDLSEKQDLTAFTLTARDPDGVFHVLQWVWTPEDTMEVRQHRDRVPYQAWAADAFIEPIPGKTIDLDWVAMRLAQICNAYRVGSIGYDRWRINDLRAACNRQGIVLPLVEFGQGYKDFSPAVDALETAVVQEHVRHGGHPVLRWCIANVVVLRDPAGNRKFDKDKSFGRIDCAVSLAMSIRGHEAAPLVIDMPFMVL